MRCDDSRQGPRSSFGRVEFAGRESQRCDSIHRGASGFAATNPGHGMVVHRAIGNWRVRIKYRLRRCADCDIEMASRSLTAEENPPSPN